MFEDWTNLLDKDKDEEPIYLDQGMPKSHYTSGNEDFKHRPIVMEQVLDMTGNSMV